MEETDRHLDHLEANLREVTLTSYVGMDVEIGDSGHLLAVHLAHPRHHQLGTHVQNIECAITPRMIAHLQVP